MHAGQNAHSADAEAQGTQETTKATVDPAASTTPATAAPDDGTAPAADVDMATRDDGDPWISAQ